MTYICCEEGIINYKLRRKLKLFFTSFIIKLKDFHDKVAYAFNFLMHLDAKFECYEEVCMYSGTHYVPEHSEIHVYEVLQANHTTPTK